MKHREALPFIEEKKQLERIKKSFEKKKIHYSQMNSWNRLGCEGYNEALNECIKIIDRKIKKLV